MFCALCEKFVGISIGLCPGCLRLLVRQRLPDEDASILRALFYYEDPISGLVRRAKIDHDEQAVKVLCQLFARSHLVRRMCQHCDVIIPVPSSLWSRYHGRMDLAYALAFAASKTFHVTLTPAPLQLGWQFKKQSHRKRRGLGLSSVKMAFPSQRVLLIDDVKTSGNTLRALQSAIYAEQVETVTLARAVS